MTAVALSRSAKAVPVRTPTHRKERDEWGTRHTKLYVDRGRKFHGGWPGARPLQRTQGAGHPLLLDRGTGERIAAYNWLILAQNSLLLPALASRSISNSMASTGDSGFSTLRSTQIRCRSSFGISSSSLRVPERWISIAGNVRLSTSLRSRMISELPVPLNSSKITSSMRDPVSIRAVAMMVSEPPSSMLRADPKKRFGRCKAFESTPPESTLPEGGTIVL